jgi:hypothetical protein
LARFLQDFEELGSGAKGKQAELRVFGELLRKNFQVYTPMVDSEGIDCLVDVGKGNYKEIQVKWREKTPLFQLRKFTPRLSFYIVCCLGAGSESEMWVIPSHAFFDMGSPAKANGRDYVRLAIGKEGSESYEKLRHYRFNFMQLLRGATPEVRNTVQQAKKTIAKRIADTHLKVEDYEREILELLSFQPKPLTRKEIIEYVYARLQTRLSKADWAEIESGGARWKSTAAWAISNLKKRGLIKPVSKNQYVLSELVRQELRMSKELHELRKLVRSSSP